MSEQEKRKSIISNFETHYAGIREQMEQDKKSFQGTDGVLEITKENAMLEEKYQELLKEIEEKTGLMDKQVTDKKSGTEDIQKQMSEQIVGQEEEIRKQIEVYKEQVKVKKNEEKEIQNLHNQYKSKYNEFSQSMKQNRRRL